MDCPRDNCRGQLQVDREDGGLVCTLCERRFNIVAGQLMAASGITPIGQPTLARHVVYPGIKKYTDLEVDDEKGD